MLSWIGSSIDPFEMFLVTFSIVGCQVQMTCVLLKAVRGCRTIIVNSDMSSQLGVKVGIPLFGVEIFGCYFVLDMV